MDIIFLSRIFAIITMFIDHLGFILGDTLSMRIIGRLSFPIFAYLVARGSFYTRSPLKRIYKLFIFALISQPIYYLLFEVSQLNILFAYALFSLIIWTVNKTKAPKSFETFLILGLSFLSIILPIEYGWYGILMLYLFYKTENVFIVNILFTILTAIYANIHGLSFSIQIYAIFSLVIINILMLYKSKTKKERSKNIFVKNFFYIFYPLHLFVLYLIKVFIL